MILTNSTNCETTILFDKYEFYSFIIYLYIFVYFYSYVLRESFFYMLTFNIIGNVITNYTMNFNIFTLVSHNYWKYNLNTIAMPQLLSILSNIIINDKLIFFKNSFYNCLIIVPLNLLIYKFISNMYKNENNLSKNFRIVTNIISIGINFIFY